MFKLKKGRKKLAKLINSNLVSAIVGRRSFWVVSHPKSGRTWLNVVLGKYFSLFYGAPENIFLKSRKKISIKHLR